ncbi:hypothetical protein [Shewanella sp. ANA-3]|uniref:hypothetical protein n=1 Tax=Shewanella sp. (strain ANA-3) TaxID=94122 RepID=UPI0002F5E9F9|nr:hypothetical protein [Shewanella sp. ANA-3]
MGLALVFYQRWQYIAVSRFWQRKAGVASVLLCRGNQQHKSLNPFMLEAFWQGEAIVDIICLVL